MATVDKAFRVKNGLVVEGSSATVNGSNVLTEASTEFLQDTTAAMFTNGSQTGITFTYNDTTGVIDAAVSSDPIFADKITFEGAIPDAYETILQVTEPTQDNTVTIPNATTTLVGKDTTDTLTNKTFNTAGTGNTLQINGNTVNSYTGSGSIVALSTSPSFSTGINLNGSSSGQTTIQASSTASGTLTLPASTGTIALTSDIPSLSGYVTETGTQTLTNKTLTSPAVDGSGIVFEGATADAYETTLTVVDPTADRTITLPNVTGTVVTTGDTGTVTNTMLAGSISNDKLVNDSVTINGYEIVLGGTASYSTDNISEGTTNKYFSNELAQDAIATAIAAGTQTNITITYDDSAGSLSFNASGGVSSLSGTANEVTVSGSTGAVTVGLPDDITIAGNVTINGTPTLATHAATKGYVDNAVAGLDWHSAVNLLAASNISLTGSTSTLVIDGHSALDSGDVGYRLLLKGQSTTSENGIYVYGDNGSTYTLTRATDADAYAELVGAAVFVLEGTVYGSTAWIQTDHYLTSFDGQNWVQFSGSGTYAAGNGLTLTGNSFSINTGVTVDLNTTQTLTNKTLTSPSITNPTISGLYLSDNNIVIEGDPDTSETTLTFTNPTADRTITFPDASGTVAFTSDITSAINALSTTDIEEGTNLYFTDERAQDAVGNSLGTGLSYNDTTGAISNSGVLSITGTTNQVVASASTGAVTLSLPQSINTTATPTFSGVTVGSVTLTDALIGTATQSLTDGTATVVDSWSASSYSSAKYVVQMKKGTDIEVLEVLVTVDGNNNVYVTEYADVISNASIGTTDADYSAGNVRLLVTASNGTTVKVHKTLIEA